VATDIDVSVSNAHACQADSLEGASNHVPRIVDLLTRVQEKLRRDGLKEALTKVLRFITLGSGASTCRTSNAVSRHVPALDRNVEVLGLRPGEWVEVKSLPEIQSTLDANGKLRGLDFLPGMQPFCGKRFKVLKRMEILYQEESSKVRRLKNTVLLGEVQCDGLLMRCDRLCYLFWREAWLRRVTDSDKSNNDMARFPSD
jgi:hypothetical protein